jgi:isopentenyl-diphosphate delta-isomerase
MPELLDVRDENGTLTGEVMVRPEVHRTEVWHGIALVWVYNSQGQILLQHRAAHLNAFPSKWDVTVSGHLSAGETPRQAAVREVAEEVGIYLKEDELEEVGTVANEYTLVYGKQHREYDFVFTACVDAEIKDLRFQAAEVLDARWSSVEDFERDLADEINSQHYSKRDPRIYQMIIDKVRHIKLKSADQ